MERIPAFRGYLNNVAALMAEGGPVLCGWRGWSAATVE